MRARKRIRVLTMRSTKQIAIAVAAVVVVAGGFAVTKLIGRPSGSGAAACRAVSGEARRTCYARLLSDRLTKHGLADAVATLDAITRGDADAAEHAHEYAHGIGIEAYGLSPDITATFAACGDGYSSGCRHGVIQAYFESRQEVTQPQVEALCQPFKSATASRWVLFQCVHGMGHGLTMFRGHDLPRALGDCDLLSDGWDRESCYGGAFMESVINATTPHHPATMLAAHSHHMAATTFKAMDPADPLYPCSIMAERYLHACYQMQTSVMLNLNHADMCDKAREPYRPACYFGAAKALVDWTATTESAFTFCGIVASQPGGPTCYQALGEEIATLLATTPEREEQCLRAEEPQAVDACRRGARIPAGR